MNQTILNSLMNLYALIAYANKEASSILARRYVESYLKQYFSRKIIEKQLEIYDYHLKNISNKSKSSESFSSSFSLLILQICENINKELHQKQKLIVLINALQFVKHWQAFSVEGFEDEKTVTEILDTIALVFKFNEIEFKDIQSFIFDQLHKVKRKKELLLVDEDAYFPIKEIGTYIKKGFKGQLFVLRIASTNTFLFRYTGKEKPEMGGKAIFPGQVYIFEKGKALKSNNFETVYYTEIVARYLLMLNKINICFEAKNIEFKFPGSSNGIHNFSFQGFSGQLIGVMGGSGTGKSTLLNVLNGNLLINSGKILINGINIHTNKEKIRGIIGYIPQDDLLIEELSVFNNLYFNAKLCFKELSDQEIIKRVKQLLDELDLWEAKDLKVGNPLNNFISGGQRKRLNIALELIRKPSVLFIDEPTSGLSSADSEKVVELLKHEALKGNFLMVNIHQPSSNIFKQFDKLILLDKGGYPIYFGDPIEAIEYFKISSHHVDATETECHCCGHVNPEQILELVEEQGIDEYGEFSGKRRYKPEFWYKLYKEKIEEKHTDIVENLKLPQHHFKPPGLFKQFKIFSKRNILSKLADKQYIVISMLIAPLLAVILGSITRYLTVNEDFSRQYIFYYNENIPAFLLMSIIVALFVGLTISAEEIIRDRKILKREKFLNLSKFSYLNSKIVFLCILSAIQAFMYVLLGNLILEIKGFYFAFWLIFFSLSFFGNLTGLNISSAFKSVVTIYILIPLILVPQILLCGVIVKFNKLHPIISNEAVVPFVGDLMASRWAYEALMVEEFKNNNYENEFFEINKNLSNASYSMNYLLPKLEEFALEAKQNINMNRQQNLYHLSYLKQEISKLVDTYTNDNPEFVKNINESIKVETIDLLMSYLKALKERFSIYIDRLMNQKDEKYFNLVGTMGQDKVNQMKLEYSNEKVAEFVLNKNEISRIKVTKNGIVRNYEPVYFESKNNIGRAQFYASEKRILNNNVETFWFNLLVIWLFNMILYIALINGWLQRLIEGFEHKKK